MSIWQFHDLIVPVEPENRVTLGEGNTPLIRSRRIGPAAGLTNLWFKVETSNPAGSFKDRMGAAAISHMLATSKTRCIATSSGNTGSALSAYCAAAGIECHIAVVETAPESKLHQMMAYGANVFRVRGSGLDPDLTAKTFARLDTIASREDSAMQVSSYIYSPEGMTGVETISHELAQQAEQLGQKIGRVFCQAGGGGLCVAVARGFESLVKAGRLEVSPAVDCVQPEGNDTMAGPLRNGDEKAHECVCTTKVSGLQVPVVNDGHLVVTECRATGGTGHLVTDEFVWETQARLAREEGIFSEPAGAVALAGALKAASNGELDPDEMHVCLVTGSGFKDGESVVRMLGDSPCPMLEMDDLAQFE